MEEEKWEETWRLIRPATSQIDHALARIRLHFRQGADHILRLGRVIEAEAAGKGNVRKARIKDLNLLRHITVKFGDNEIQGHALKLKPIIAPSPQRLRIESAFDGFARLDDDPLSCLQDATVLAARVNVNLAFIDTDFLSVPIQRVDAEHCAQCRDGDRAGGHGEGARRVFGDVK